MATSERAMRRSLFVLFVLLGCSPAPVTDRRAKETELARAWERYERAEPGADRDRLRVNIEREVKAVGGLLRVANIWWLDGEQLQPDEAVEYREDDSSPWRKGKVGPYAMSLLLEDGTDLNLLDLDDAAELRRN